MAWTIEFTTKPDKLLDKMIRHDAGRIIKLLDEISVLADPRSRGHILTANLGGLWRYRAGDWRIVCRIEDDRIVIVVITIGHRREGYG